MGCLGTTIDKNVREKPSEPPNHFVQFDRGSLLIDNLVKRAKELYPEGEQADPVALIRRSIREHLRARGVAGLEAKFLPWTATEDYTGVTETRSVLLVSYRRALALVGVYGYGADVYFAFDTYLNLGAWVRLHSHTRAEGCLSSLADGSNPLGQLLASILGTTVRYFDWYKVEVNAHEFHHADVRSLGEIIKHTVEQLAREIKEIYRIDETVLASFVSGGPSGGKPPGTPGGQSGAKGRQHRVD